MASPAKQKLRKLTAHPTARFIARCLITCAMGRMSGRSGHETLKRDSCCS
jgi:hypothetical protein